ncbi:unnamed protein product [Caenorhabditis auriculariae]|uniref:Uncharacterized protein n=1 Tax=Caenorhabditis auriculariae TaxID=2777116 RepID=A0A8S1GPH1_9PELO|nr:unnamed protein product [Caenorhabditis auriculariae]
MRFLLLYLKDLTCSSLNKWIPRTDSRKVERRVPKRWMSAKVRRSGPPQNSVIDVPTVIALDDVERKRVREEPDLVALARGAQGRTVVDGGAGGAGNALFLFISLFLPLVYRHRATA